MLQLAADQSIPSPAQASHGDAEHPSHGAGVQQSDAPLPLLPPPPGTYSPVMGPATLHTPFSRTSSL